ncbi:MAG: hypothetical protein ACI3YK_04270 [Eubacteriales bacterium]
MTIYKWHSGLAKKEWKRKLYGYSAGDLAMSDVAFRFRSFGPFYFFHYLGPHYYREFNNHGTVGIDRDRAISFGMVRSTEKGVVLTGLLIVDYIISGVLWFLLLFGVSYYQGVVVGVATFLILFSVFLYFDNRYGNSKQISYTLKSLIT